jgi:DNA-binding NarL/FixJ family response regulator
LARNLRQSPPDGRLPASGAEASGLGSWAGGCARGEVGALGDSVRCKWIDLTMAQAKQTQVKDNRKRVLLVDDHAVVRFGIAQLINQQSDLMVCGEEEDAPKGLSAIAKLKPDLVIADISLKESSGLDLMRNIKAQYPKLPMLVVSTHDEAVYAEIAFRAGALGYLMKAEALEKVVAAIRRVLSGNIYVSDALAARLLQQQFRGQTDIQQSPVKGLSDRELEVFQLIGTWKKTKEIAHELHLSIKTIEYYREQIKQKLNLRSAVELTQSATSWVQSENPT